MGEVDQEESWPLLQPLSATICPPETCVPEDTNNQLRRIALCGYHRFSSDFVLGLACSVREGNSWHRLRRKTQSATRRSGILGFQGTRACLRIRSVKGARKRDGGPAEANLPLDATKRNESAAHRTRAPACYGCRCEHGGFSLAAQPGLSNPGSSLAGSARSGENSCGLIDSIPYCTTTGADIDTDKVHK